MHSDASTNSRLQELKLALKRGKPAPPKRGQKPRPLAISKAELMEGATLYQLGVVATISRPPALDRAEALLKQALELEPEEGAARWATLQQLGRVASRRGQLLKAEQNFQKALVGYKRAYRSDLHINVAAVHHQLGSVSVARKLFSEVGCRQGRCQQPPPPPFA